MKKIFLATLFLAFFSCTSQTKQYSLDQERGPSSEPSSQEQLEQLCNDEDTLDKMIPGKTTIIFNQLREWDKRMVFEEGSYATEKNSSQWSSIYSRRIVIESNKSFSGEKFVYYSEIKTNPDLPKAKINTSFLFLKELDLKNRHNGIVINPLRAAYDMRYFVKHISVGSLKYNLGRQNAKLVAYCK